MFENEEACSVQALPSIFAMLVITVLGMLIGKKVIQKVLKLLRSFGILNSNQTHADYLNREIAELKNTTCQIAYDWIEMTKLMSSYREDLNNVVGRLQGDLESTNNMLCQNINVSLEEEYLRNDERFTKINQVIETLLDEFYSVKDLLQKYDMQNMADKNSSEASSDELESNIQVVKEFMNNSTQTEYEAFPKKRVREAHSKSSHSSINWAEHEPARSLVSVLKKNIAELMKEAKLYLCQDREEDRRDMQILFNKLAEDREDIKLTIVRAFSSAAEQAKKNFDQFGHIGQEAMHYIAVLNGNTNKILRAKLEETDDRLKEVLVALNRQIFDASAIKETLDGIDAQLDDTFRRVELGCQKNTEHCEEITICLQETTRNWDTKASHLEEMAKKFAEETIKMRNMLNELRCLGNNKLPDQSENQQMQGYPEGNLQVNGDDLRYQNVCLTNVNVCTVTSQYPDHVKLLSALLQACFDKIDKLNNQLEDGTGEIRTLIQELVQKLQSLNDLADSLDEEVASADIGMCSGAHLECNRDESKDHIRRAQTRDVDRRTPLRASRRFSDDSFQQKTKKAVAIHKTVSMIDGILHGANGKDDEDIFRSIRIHDLQKDSRNFSMENGSRLPTSSHYERETDRIPQGEIRTETNVSAVSL